MTFKLAVIGSRNFKPLAKVTDYLDKVLELIPNLEVITGGARGVDQCAEGWCLCANRNIPCQVIKPVNPSDKFSYLLRNVEILTLCEGLVAFHDGSSRGTQFVIDYCKARNYPIKIIKCEE